MMDPAESSWHFWNNENDAGLQVNRKGSQLSAGQTVWPGVLLPLCNWRDKHREKTKAIFQGCCSSWETSGANIFWGFFISSTMCIPQVRSSLMLTPKKQKSETNSTQSLLMMSGWVFIAFFIKSTTSFSSIMVRAFIPWPEGYQF